MTAIPMHDEHEHHHDHDTQIVQLWIKTALLFGLGLYFAYNIASGNLANYINARFAWLSYVATALFLLIAVFSAIHLLRDHGKHDGHEHRDHNHAEHDHEQISWRSLIIIAVPLVLGTLIPSQPLGAQAVSGSISTTSASTTIEQFNTLPPPEQRNVLDWLRAFNNGDYSQFEGLPADVIGFVYTEPSFDANTFMVARFTISCCVADASAIGLPVYWQGADLPQGQWIEVKGTFSLADFRGDHMPVLYAESIDQVAQPEHPYLYP